MKTLADRLQRLFKFRFAVFYPVVLYLALFCNIDRRYLFPGTMVMLAGAAVRLWSNCYAIKMDKLTTSGPYAFVRNPLYLGTAMIMLGVAVVLNIYPLGGVFFAVAAIVYYRTIRSEERMLTKKFGEDFLDYLRHVPAMIPRLTPYTKGEKWPFSRQRLWESREHKILIWLAIAVIAFLLKETLWVERQSVTSGAVGLIALAVALTLLDLLGEVVRKRQKKKS
jgi:protein-S-isoprenylcysteine O-methyltransferase Ste14